jgi:hypothetical protein
MVLRTGTKDENPPRPRTLIMVVASGRAVHETLTKFPLGELTASAARGRGLYKMATRFLPFRGDSTGAVFDAILHNDPTEAVRLNIAVPAELRRIE